MKAEIEGNKLTVMGKKIDASKLREKLSNKTKKKVDLVSPQPKKEKDSKPKNNEDEDQISCNDNNNKSDKKTDDNKKKPKEVIYKTTKPPNPKLGSPSEIPLSDFVLCFFSHP